jgi:hypothetical protein
MAFNTGRKLAVVKFVSVYTSSVNNCSSFCGGVCAWLTQDFKGRLTPLKLGASTGKCLLDCDYLHPLMWKNKQCSCRSLWGKLMPTHCKNEQCSSGALLGAVQWFTRIPSTQLQASTLAVSQWEVDIIWGKNGHLLGSQLVGFCTVLHVGSTPWETVWATSLQHSSRYCRVINLIVALSYFWFNISDISVLGSLAVFPLSRTILWLRGSNGQSTLPCSFALVSIELCIMM